MPHEGWSPAWLDADDEHDGVGSGLGSGASFRLSFDMPSSVTPGPRATDTLPAEDERRIIAGFWSDNDTEHAATARPRPRGTRRPEIPGYEILEELGRGSMGVVYRARQVRLNRMVALKMILAGDLAGGDALARFGVEAATIARLTHAHIVQIYAIGDWEGRPYVELEYVDGGSLASRLDGVPWAPRSAARLLESLARAAGEAHRLGVIHRDLKPANILMTEAGEPKISDFGLAKTLEEDAGLTKTESILGSPNYMAPEQAEGRARDVGPPADIYALGATLYELITGRPPFIAPTILATLELVKNADPVPPRRLQPLLDRDLETICLKCLEKEPGRRYATADDLADDLAAFLAGEPIKARRAMPWERVAKWARRRPSTAALIAVSILAFIGTVGGVEWRRAEVAWLAENSRQHETLLRSQMDRFILLAGEAMRRGEWGTARTQLNTALAFIRSEARLADVKDSVKGLLDLCGRKLAEQRGRDEARARLSDFQKLHDAAVFYQSDYTGLDPEANIRAGRASALDALAKFGRDPGRDPGRAEGEARDLAPDARHFDAPEIERIDADCYELALLLAGSVSRPLAGEDPARQGRVALDLLESARHPGRIGPAWHLRRAWILERSGDGPGAVADRERAAAIPAPAWSAVDHFLKGEQAYHRNDLKLAIESFRLSLAIQPDRFWAQYFLAVCLLREHRPAEAQSALIACQSRRPRFAWAYLLKGFAEGEMREFDLAEDDFRRANELHLNDQERYVMLVNRGVMRIRRGRNEDAVVDLAGAIALRPGQFEAYINLAMAYRNLGRAGDALTTLARAIEGHPDEAILRRARGQAYRLASKPEEALADLRRAIELTPADDPASAADSLEIATILQQSGRSEESLADCDRATRLRPRWAEAHRARGVALMMLRRYDEAVASFDTCLARGGASASLHEARGLALASRGSHERALADFTMALNLGKPTPSLLANRGWAYLLGGASAAALRDFDESLRLDPSNGHALGGRALTNVQLRKPREGIADALASVRLSPDDSRQAYNAARVHCQAAACLESSPDRNDAAMALAGRYRGDAVRLLGRALDLCPAADRPRFWDDFVRKDASLDPVRRSRTFLDLGSRASAGRPSIASSRERAGP